MLIILQRLLFLWLGLQLWGCGATSPNPPIPDEETMPSKRYLLNQLREHGNILVVYHAVDPQGQQQYKQYFEDLSQRRRRGLSFTIKSSQDVSISELKNSPVLLIGGVSSHPWIRDYQDNLPFSWTQQTGIRFDNTAYTSSTDVLTVGLYPSPWNPQLPVSILTGNQDEAILSLLTQGGRRSPVFGWGGWGYQIYKEGKRMVMGDFSSDPKTRWQIDRRVHWDFQKTNSNPVVSSKNFQFYGDTSHFSLGEIQQLSELCEADVSRIVSFVGGTGSSGSMDISYHLYRTPEEKGLHLNNSTQAHVDFEKKAVFTVKNPYFPGHHLRKENELILRQLLQLPQSPILEEGLALQFTTNWKQKGFRYWGKRMAEADLLPRPEDLFFPETTEAQSSLIRTCMAGLWVDFLLGKWGKEQFLAQYPTWKPNKKQLQAWQKEWQTYLDKLPLATPSHGEGKKPSFFKGFNYAHEGYRIYNGYGSTKSAIALEYLHKLGSNAVAIVPYSWMPNPNEATPLRFSDGPGSENDEGVIHTVQTAREMGMYSLLKPQIWFRGSWPGELEMKNDKEWERFFTYYEHWIGHYALLAEMENIDMFCVGVEFVKASLTQEKRWRKLIQKIRKLYSGPLVYCANWGEEFEKMKFWDEFDYLGISCYYPMSDAENPSDKELLKNFERSLNKVEAVSKKFGKPCIAHRDWIPQRGSALEKSLRRGRRSASQ